MSIKLLSGPLLAERTTLALGGHAVAEIVIDTLTDLESLPSLLNSLGGMPFTLGKGSNLLVKEGDLPLVILSIGLRKIAIVAATNKRAVLHVGAGLGLPRLLSWTAKYGLTGLEGLIGIPGSLGGAIVMNAGSWGIDIGQVLTKLQIFTPETGLIWLVPDEFATSYRSLTLTQPADWFIVTTAELSLQHDKPERIWRTMVEHYAKKVATQPLTAKSCGCAFKNPAGPIRTPSAGQLLEKAGLRGFCLGGIRFATLHANFLVNETNGTSSQALELLDLAEGLVLKCSGITLEREVQVVPPCSP